MVVGVGDVIAIAELLWNAVSRARDLWKTRRVNVSFQQELQQFIDELSTNIHHLSSKASSTTPCSSICISALEALQKDLKKAHAEVDDIIDRGLLKSILDAKKAQSTMRSLRERVMASFQIQLIFVTLDVAIDSKNEILDTIQQSMSKLDISAKLSEMYSENSKANSALKVDFSNELKGLLGLVVTRMDLQQEETRAKLLSEIKSIKPQTTEAEKFAADVLAAIEEKERTKTKISTEGGLCKWYHDPITCAEMCDPVKATDGRTFDRWTILGYDGENLTERLTVSPYIRAEEQPFIIFTDDIDIRSRIFAKFPVQEEKFKNMRAGYRSLALEEAKLGHFADATRMLNDVLQWDPNDQECRKARDEMQKQIETILAKEELARKPMHELMGGETLKAGQYLLNGRYMLRMQEDDNLVVYYETEDRAVRRALWSSKTWRKVGGHGGCILTMQKDGDLVMRGKFRNNILWSSASAAPRPNDDPNSLQEAKAAIAAGVDEIYKLVLKDDGGLEVRSSSRGRIWGSRPRICLAAGESLKAGEFIAEYGNKLCMQSDDNLVLYRLQDGAKDEALWTSGTTNAAGGKGECCLLMQDDGNLVIRHGGGVIWASNYFPGSIGKYCLNMMDDGRIVVHNCYGQQHWKNQI